MSIRNALASNERGKALIELMLVAPLLIGIALPSIDAVNFIRTGHLLNAVAREAGRTGFSCAYLTTPQPDIERCLATNVNGALPAVLDGVAASAEITVSLWEYSAAGPVFKARFQRGALETQMPAARIAALHSYTPEKNRIMVVETRSSINPMTPYFASERYLIMVM